MKTMKMTATMNDGSVIDGSVSDFFNDRRDVKFVEITDPLFTIRVSNHWLYASENGRYYADVLNGKGEFVTWNMTIYNGNSIFINNKKYVLSVNLAKYQAIIDCRNAMMAAVTERI